MSKGLSKDSKRKDQIIPNVFLDRRTHESLVEYCRRNSFYLSTGFIKATERGMRFFRAVYHQKMKQDYLLLKKQERRKFISRLVRTQ
jgi:hypothetical protein